MYILTGSSIGYKNKIKNSGSQDFIIYERLDRGIVMSIADGHSNDFCKHSDEGAKIATIVSNNILKEIYTHFYQNSLDKVERLNYIKSIIDNKILQKDIVSMWRNEVANHYKKIYPIVYKVDYFKYGTTLLSVLATEDFNIYIHIGDGEIILNNGYLYKKALEHKSSLVPNIVNSLCMDEAYKGFSVELEEIEDKRSLKNIILFSDGYSNSFKSEYMSCLSLNKYIKKIKFKAYDIQKMLDEDIEYLSNKKSKDDISIGFIIV